MSRTGHGERHVQRDLVVIGASAGGVEALGRVVGGLPPEFPAAVLVVLHVAPEGTSVLPTILSRQGVLPAVHAEDGQELERGQIYVAPPDRHLLVHEGTARITRGPRENGHRPAIDPLFRSAARAAGERVIGVVLSGLLDDGVAGLRFIKEIGGMTIVQDPDDALFSSMPENAIRVAEPHHIVPAADIPLRLCSLVEQTVPDVVPALVDAPASTGPDPDVEAVVDGPPSALTCPECGGALWEERDGELVRYACHVGHAFSSETLAEEHTRALEQTLWSALRALQESADMQRRLARRATAERQSRHIRRAEETDAQADALREMLAALGAPAVDSAAEPAV